MASTSPGSTVASASSPGGSRKRKRAYKIDSEDDEQQEQLRESPKIWERDETFYLEDGSCIFLVQDTLFNVHRSMLSKDNSSFSTMFTLPQGDTVAEGHSDDNPIILVGDTPDEFRNFLQALYALPPELLALHSNLTKLIDIARISNKYSFKSFETWALDAIQEFVNRKPSPILNSIPPPGVYSFSQDTSSGISGNSTSIESTAQLTRLIRLAQMCKHERLLNAMMGLLRQLMGTSLQYAYLAMTLADELDLRVLRGAAYLEVMQKSVVVKRGNFCIRSRHLTSSSSNGLSSNPVPSPATASPTSTVPPKIASGTKEGDIDEDGRLIVSPSQRMRLLAGYYRLTRTWEHLRAKPPQFDHSPSCGATWHQHGCTQSWLDFWKEKTKSDDLLSLGLTDVIGRLRLILKDYDRWGSAAYMHHDCKMAARRSLVDVIRAVEESLPDFFSEGEDDEDG